MKYRHYFKSGKRFVQYFRHYSKDPSKTFREKGLAEENRYFRKKQEEEIRKLREQLHHLENKQQNLEKLLERTSATLEKICDSKDCGKSK